MFGPILFVLYTHPISEIVSYHSLSHHSFSDDNQLTNLAILLNFLKLFIQLNLVSLMWMANNQLQLNNDKTEMILIATKTVHKSGGFWHQICHHSSQPRCLSWSYSLFPTANLLHLSYLLYWTLSDYCNMPLCLKMSPKNCCVHLLRLDYCNSLLSGCPKYLLYKLQKVQNNTARLIFRTTRSAHITPMLHSLHGLPIVQRIEYKLSLL